VRLTAVFFGILPFFLTGAGIPGASRRPGLGRGGGFTC